MVRRISPALPTIDPEISMLTQEVRTLVEQAYELSSDINYTVAELKAFEMDRRRFDDRHYYGSERRRGRRE